MSTLSTKLAASGFRDASLGGDGRGLAPPGRSATVLAMVGAMSAAIDQGGVPGQVERPSLVAVHAVADRLPSGPVPVEVAVLQFDRVRSGPSATNRTSTSLVSSGSVSTCQCGRMSQLNTTRAGGW